MHHPVSVQCSRLVLFTLLGTFEESIYVTPASSTWHCSTWVLIVLVKSSSTFFSFLKSFSTYYSIVYKSLYAVRIILGHFIVIAVHCCTLNWCNVLYSSTCIFIYFKIRFTISDYLYLPLPSKKIRQAKVTVKTTRSHIPICLSIINYVRMNI